MDDVKYKLFDDTLEDNIDFNRALLRRRASPCGQVEPRRQQVFELQLDWIQEMYMCRLRPSFPAQLKFDVRLATETN